MGNSQELDIQVLQYALKSQEAVRPCNDIDGPIERVDTCFNYLTQLYFFDQKGFRKLLQQFSSLLKKPTNELGWALRGYFAYLKEDHKEAAASFLEAIVLAPRNIDNWFDYAFALRHLGSHEASLEIFFNTKKMIESVVTAPVRSRKTRLMRHLKI